MGYLIIKIVGFEIKNLLCDSLFIHVNLTVLIHLLSKYPFFSRLLIDL